MTATCQRCGHSRIPVQKSFSVSGSIPVPDNCPSCGEPLHPTGGLAEDDSPERESLTEKYLRRIRG